MGQELEFGTREWMLAHAVAIEDVISTRKKDLEKHDVATLTDIMIMTLCKAFLLPQPEPKDLDAD